MKSIGIILFIFALMAPIGIIIGLTAAKQGPFVDIIFLSISGGTFIYISCTEIIAREFKKNDETGTRPNWHLWVKLLCVLLGIIVICSLWSTLVEPWKGKATTMGLRKEWDTIVMDMRQENHLILKKACMPIMGRNELV